MKKIALITGGDKGIGKAIVEKISRKVEKVIFTYNTDLESAKNLKTNIPNSEFFQCNLKEFEKIKELVEIVKKRFGQIDILVNNAGFDEDSTLLKMNESTWHDVIDINLKSIYYLTQGFLKEMQENRWGRIINISSIAGFTGAFGKSNYSTAKAGIIGFTKSIALETASKNITVNAIAPGAINTAMYLRIPEKYRDIIKQSIPMRRVGEPEEVADLIDFLISEKASYITGQTIHINGGSYLG